MGNNQGEKGSDRIRCAREVAEKERHETVGFDCENTHVHEVLAPVFVRAEAVPDRDVLEALLCQSAG